MRALIYDEIFPDVAPFEIKNIKSVLYIQKGKMLQITHIGTDNVLHEFSVNMDSTQYKRRVVFE